MTNVKNLNTKKITEFTPEDTIYIRYNKSDQRPLYLCQFVKYEKGVVYGKVIEAEEWNRIIGETISARIEQCGLYGNATNEPNRSYFRYFDGSLYAMHPLEEHKVVENGLHVEKHPSYGMAGFHRSSSSHGVSLFGSSIQNKQTITLTIKRAEHRREHFHDWYYGNQELIQIEMSQAQFAEMITSFNMGDGVPVTIKHVNHDHYPEPPFISKMDVFSGEFENQMKNYGVQLKQVMETATEILKNKPTINKTDRDTILKSIENVISQISGGIPYVQGQFVGAMEDTVQQAKGEIEAFVENKIRHAGLEALGLNAKDNTPLIEIKSE